MVMVVLAGCDSKRSWPILTYPSINMDRRRENPKRISDDSHYLGCDSSRGPFEYKEGILISTWKLVKNGSLHISAYLSVLYSVI
jgi:hypothetical protein